MTIREKIQAYYSLTKPGVLYGNVITAVAGFLFAANGHIKWGLFLATLIGITLVIASACVVNNYLDQDIDKVMTRTKKRAIVSGLVPARHAAIFGVILGVLGFTVLTVYTSLLVTALAVIGFFDYVVLYGMLSKRLSMYGTLVGSISGAIPILVGYCAAATFDLGAFLVFTVLFVWQIPEFYSIAIFRQEEYEAAKVPVITVVKSIHYTKVQILLYTIAFVVFSLLLTAAGYTSVSYFIIMVIVGAYWVWLGVKGLAAHDNNMWARRMFHFSLNALMIFSSLIAINAWLP